MIDGMRFEADEPPVGAALPVGRTETREVIPETTVATTGAADVTPEINEGTTGTA